MLKLQNIPVAQYPSLKAVIAQLFSHVKSRVGLAQSSEFIAYQQKLKLFVQALGEAQQQSTTSEAGEMVDNGDIQYQQHLKTAKFILNIPDGCPVEIQEPNKSIVTFTKLGPNNWKVSPIAGFPKAKSWSDLEMMENMEGKNYECSSGFNATTICNIT